MGVTVLSLSARRAWIEISNMEVIKLMFGNGRSPQGERG